MSTNTIDPNTWVDKYSDYLFNYTIVRVDDKEIAQDLVQETFFAGLKSMKNFKGEASERTWLISILKRKIIDHYRKTKIRKKHSEQFLQNVNQLEEIETSWEVLQQIDNIYTHLDTKTEEIFKLSREEGMSYTEIADKKSISIKTVESHISKALQAFRKGLKDFL